MVEIEVKVIEIKKEEIAQRLIGLGAKKEFEADISSLSYDFEDGRLAKEHSFLRLRQIGEEAFLTYKKLQSQERAKDMVEIETPIEDTGAIHNILIALGMEPYADKAKHRTEYSLGNVKFDIDEYQIIPAYMEIEAPDIDAIYDYVHKLGLPEKNVKSWTSKELFGHYGITVPYHRI